MGEVIPLDHCALLMYQPVVCVHVPAFRYCWEGGTYTLRPGLTHSTLARTLPIITHSDILAHHKGR